ncbi:MAG: hypothetical protein CR997_02770 [Acidobacteria bacterium]|nr:MAG: hypothetical protein CR997_02770 [Acidobacteriota bacterium]
MLVSLGNLLKVNEIESGSEAVSSGSGFSKLFSKIDNREHFSVEGEDNSRFSKEESSRAFSTNTGMILSQAVADIQAKLNALGIAKTFGKETALIGNSKSANNALKGKTEVQLSNFNKPGDDQSGSLLKHLFGETERSTQQVKSLKSAKHNRSFLFRKKRMNGSIGQLQHRVKHKREYGVLQIQDGETVFLKSGRVAGNKHAADAVETLKGESIAADIKELLKAKAINKAVEWFKKTSQTAAKLSKERQTNSFKHLNLGTSQTRRLTDAHHVAKHALDRDGAIENGSNSQRLTPSRWTEKGAHSNGLTPPKPGAEGHMERTGANHSSSQTRLSGVNSIEVIPNQGKQVPLKRNFSDHTKSAGKFVEAIQVADSEQMGPEAEPAKRVHRKGKEKAEAAEKRTSRVKAPLSEIKNEARLVEKTISNQKDATKGMLDRAFQSVSVKKSTQEALYFDTSVQKTKKTHKLNVEGMEARLGNAKEVQLETELTKPAEKTFKQMIVRKTFDEISSSVRFAPKEVLLKLEPEFLGKMKIQVSVEQDQVSARIFAENQTVVSMLKGSQGELQQHLKDQGLGLNSFDVNHDGGSGDGSAREQADQASGRMKGQLASEQEVATESAVHHAEYRHVTEKSVNVMV